MSDSSNALASVVDAATTDAGAETTSDISTPEVSTGTPGSDSIETQPTVTTSTDDGAQTEGTEQSAETTQQPAVDATTKQITSALKEWSDSYADNPSMQKTVRAVKDAAMRGLALQKEFGGVDQVRQLATLANEIAGDKVTPGSPLASTLKAAREEHARLSQLSADVADADARILEADPEITKQILSDLEGAGKMENAGKLGLNYLNGLLGSSNPTAQKAWAQVASNVIHYEAQRANVAGVIAQAWQALQNGDRQGAQGAIQTLHSYYQQIAKMATESFQDPLSEERAALTKEKNDWAASKHQEAVMDVVKQADAESIRSLGASLKPYLDKPFFRSLGRPALLALAAQIKQSVYERGAKDTAYQKQMKVLQGKSSTPQQRQGALQYHAQFMRSISDAAVRDTVNRIYPMWAKGSTSAAGRQAAATAKAATVAGTGLGSKTNPQYVGQRPSRASIDWQKTTDMDLITGKATLVNGKTVTWRKYQTSQQEAKGQK